MVGCMGGWVGSGQITQNHVTPCFDCLTKMSHVVKVSHKTIQNWSRYLGLCVIMVKT